MVLVIGYGNTLRGDDAAGYLVAEEVESWNLPGVRAIATHQLTPELAADMAEVDAVYFVDAWQVEVVGAEENEDMRDKSVIKPVLMQIEVTEAPTSSDHAWTPNVLMQMARNLYDAQPICYQILIPAIQFEYGERLSAIARQGVTRSLETLKNTLLK